MHRYCGAIHQSNVVDHRAADPFESGSSDSTAAGRPTGRGDREASIDCNGFLAGHWLQEADPEADPVEIRNLIHTMIDGVVQLSGWMVFIQWRSQSQLSQPAEGKYAPAIYT